MSTKKKPELGTGKNKINIEQAWIDDSMGEGFNFLWGKPVDHPREVWNGKLIHTSYIQAVRGNLVETKYSVYNVLSWDEKKIHPQAELF